MATLKRFLRRARTLLWTALSILVVVSATMVGIGKLLMPYSERYQPKLEAWLSHELGQNVTLESFDGEWNAFGPRLSLRGLRLQPLTGGKGEVAIAQAALDLKPLNAFIPGRALYNFLVIGADFRLVHDAEGKYVLSGFGVGGAGTDETGGALRNLVGIGELILENSSLEYIDEKRDIRLNLTTIDARLQLDGKSVAMTFEANLSDEETNRVYGEVDASGLLVLGKREGLREAHWQVTIRELLLHSLQGRVPANPFLPEEGRVNAEFWCDWSAQNPILVEGVVDLRNGTLVIDNQETVVEHLNSRVNWRYGGKRDWRLDFNELLFDDGEHSWTAPGIALARNPQEDLGLWISADYLPLEAPLKLARNIMSMYATRWPEFLPESATGTVSGLELVLDRNWRIRLARGTVRHASLSGWGKWPDLRGMDGQVDLGRGYGSVALHANRLEVDWPRMFRDPLAFTLPGCDVDLSWGDHWQVGFHRCNLVNDDLALSGEILMAGNEGRPAVDVNVAVDRGDIAKLAPYWPQGIMKEKAVEWLRRGLLGGIVTEGRFQIHGDMDNWPFRNAEGRFEALARIESAELDYIPGWPRARAVDVTARFNGPGMAIEGTVGEIGGVGVQSVTADIEDFKTPLLQVRYEARSTLNALVGFVVQSPLQEQLGTDLGQFGFSGPAATTGVLRMPLGAAAVHDLTIDGSVALQGDRFAEPVSEIVLDGIIGDLHYNRDGIAATGLEAQYKDKPAKLDLHGRRDAAERFRADLTGVFEVRDVMPEFLLQEYRELALIRGQANWLASVVVPAPKPGGVSGAELLMKSDLVGVVMDFPDPLHKVADESLPMSLHYPLSGLSSLLDLELDKRVRLKFDLKRSANERDRPTAVNRTVISLGGESQELPPPGFFRIGGAAESLNLDGWLKLVTAGVKDGRGLGGLKLENCTLETRQLRFLDRSFEDVGLDLAVTDEDIKAEFSGADIDGHVGFNIDSVGSGSLSAEFERLVLAKPLSSGVGMESDPGELPALHLWAKSFQYAGVELGETRIEAYPTQRSFHFEKVESESPHLSVRASGDWSLAEGGQRSDFSILVTSESLGELMQSLGFGSGMEGGQTVLHFNAWWPGSPAAFELSRLNGALDFNVSQGQITNAGSGTGRLLGLLSVQALPKRLALDFRDVFDSGFVFDEAKGSFRMENGTARTDDVILSSSAANISMSGSTDLVAQKYDQVMVIRPGLGNTLPVIGALAGGPGGAAAGLALQGLLQKQLGEAGQVKYTITGSWDDPLIEPVLKEKSGD